ncbi:hypothetical protein SKAU_G00187410 [Synaphobranchus kaupii]|uniref:Uncharacterized protein n=1 Tax=Synaphobranchus kaupii TaxID=118154 RepID=A0A9Q1FCX6_SYNKA|nr:hypothetical protein SKAU_G00187410 [Synaphobranchus kaupii]
MQHMSIGAFNTNLRGLSDDSAFVPIVLHGHTATQSSRADNSVSPVTVLGLLKASGAAPEKGRHTESRCGVRKLGARSVFGTAPRALGWGSSPPRPKDGK